MEAVNLLLQGFAVLLTWKILAMMMLGLVLGIFVGVLPGLGGPNGVAILLPITFTMDPTTAIVMLAFFIGYARVPATVEAAATLSLSSANRRAWVVVLPLVAGSLSAAAALIAALTYADRDVASLLLPPGASRLMLDLYLLSANAPAATIGITALVVRAVAVVTLVIAPVGPALHRRRAG